MNFRQVEIFKAVMDTGTVTGAASRLHISQPAASKLLGQLERDLGFAVFDRVKGRLLPTMEARSLYELVERTWTSMDDLAHFARDLREMKHGHLVIGVMPVLSNRWIPSIVARFLRDRPQVRVSIQTRSSAKVVEWVAAQQVDVGIALLTMDDPAVAQETLMDLEAVCVLPANHRLAAKPVIEPTDLRDEPFVSLSTLDRWRELVDAVFLQAGVRRRLRVDAVLGSVANALVAEGVGVSIVDPLTAGENRDLGNVIRPFRPRIAFEVRLLRPLHRPRSRIADAFVAELKASVAADNPGRPSSALFASG